MPSVDLEMGRIHYEEAGPPEGRPVVCLPGFLMGASLWRELAARLGERGLRVIALTLPVGAHPEAMKAGADVTPRGQARIVADVLDALGLEDVVLVGNDSGGAIAQVVAVDHPRRVGALVLTNCDTYEHFPPRMFKPLVAAAKLPAALRAMLLPLKTAPARRSPAGYGLLSHGDVDHLAREWVKPVLEDDGVFEDTRRFTASLDSAVTIDAAERLKGFDGPIVLAWGTDDRLFPLAHAERLAADVPGARLVPIEHSRTFVMIDQPDRLASVVAEVAGAVPAATPSR